MSILRLNIDMFEVYVDFIDTFVTCVEKTQIFDMGLGNGDIVTVVCRGLKLCGGTELEAVG